LEIQHRVEASLARFKLHRQTANNGSGGASESSFAAKELIHTLSTVNDNNHGGDAAGEGPTNPVGQHLANPTSLLKFTVANPDLRRQLNPNTNNAAKVATNTAANATTKPAPAYITLKGHLTFVTPQIARDALQLADELHLGEVEALGLYAEAKILTEDGNNRGDGFEEGGMEWESSGKNSTSAAQTKWEEDEFVRLLIKGGKVGFETKKGPQSLIKSTVQQQQQQPLQSKKEKKSRPPSATVCTARRLFFRERAALLTTLSDLVRHRVEAADEVVASSQSSGAMTEDRPPKSSASAVLAATDQLLKAGLVNNLIKTVRELTAQMVQIGETLKSAERRNKDGFTPTAAAPVAAPAIVGFGGAFGASAAPPVAPGSALEPESRMNWDMEYALLGFTQMSRQIAVECLFYLAYHTQLTVEEVVALIDLIKELTNGSGLPQGGLGNTQGGAGLGQVQVEKGLPLLDPLLKDVPSPYEEMDSLQSGSISTPWPQQQQAYNFYSGVNNQQQWNMHHHQPTLKLKDRKEWERELITSLWKRGQPQLLQCVSTLIMSVVCAFNSRHVLVERENHDVNSFGVGNAFFPPQNQGPAADASSTQALLHPIHQRLDPNSPAAEEAWKRSDIWGLLLVPYALLLRNAASQLMTPRAGGSPAHHRGGTAEILDVKNTFSKCLMAASQLKSLTFARLSLIPSFGMPSSTNALLFPSSSDGSSASSGVFDFYASTFAEFTAQYIDALGATGTLPITRKEWLEEEVNLAQSEWMERKQKREFGVWAGQEQEQTEEDAAANAGPRKVNVMDRPDCLEDVFALVSSACDVYPAGARALWYVGEEQQQVLNNDEDGMEAVAVARSPRLVLAPSRALQTLDLLHPDSDSSLFVYLSFLASLALSDAPGMDGTQNGASVVHRILCGERTINQRAPERHIHFLWSQILGAIRWYAENLSQENEDVSTKNKASAAAADRIRNSAPAESSTSYYYMASGNTSNSSRGMETASSSSTANTERSNDGVQSSSNSSVSNETKELDEVGRHTLMSLLCLMSNVASKCYAAREFILAIQIPAQDDTNDGRSVSDGGIQDGSLEILFSLLTIASLPPDIRGMAFSAIANLLPADENLSNATASSAKNAALRAWELLELCQFVPIKLLSQYSSFAAGAGTATIPAHDRMALRKQQQQGVGGSGFSNDELPVSAFPASSDYSMIYQFEHIESPLGTFQATEGFLFLLSTLVKVAGCPPTLGNQWRLRPGIAPYVEYVTDFVLPRATGMAKDIRNVEFRGVAEECRLVERALEVVEAVLVRYVVPPPMSKECNVSLNEVKHAYQSTVKLAMAEMGLSPVASEIFCCDVDNLNEEEIRHAIQDFSNVSFHPSQDGGLPTNNIPNGNQILEASFGNRIPFPKTPGFGILSNLLSSSSSNGSRGHLFQIIQKILSQNGGVTGIPEYGETVHSRSLAVSLFRETPPDIKCAEEGTRCKARQEGNVEDAWAYQEAMSALQQGMIQPLEPLLLLSYLEQSSGGDHPENGRGAGHIAHGVPSSDAVLWKERSILLSLRILCAAAAREKAFMRSIEAATGGRAPLSSSAQLSVIPTLLFKGPIHGSYAHRFVREETVSVSRLSNLLVRNASSTGDLRGGSPEILPIITDYVGYFSSSSIGDPQGIARNAFGIVSYMTHTMPQAECVPSLCGPDDVNAIRLTNAFAKGLSLPFGDEESSMGTTVDLRAAILDLILSNMNIIDSTSPSNKKENVSLLMLGLNTSSRPNCLDVILELISNGDGGFVLDPKTSSSATKCFEILYRVCEVGANNAQLHFMEKLRCGNFWQAQVARYLGIRGPSTPSVFREVSKSFRFEHGDDVHVSRRDNDFLHSISWLMKGLAIELHSLMGHHDNKRTSMTSSNNQQLQSLLHRLMSPPNLLLLATLMDIPLGQSSNGYIRERLHSIALPTSDVLQDLSTPMKGPAEICAGYQMIDAERLLSFRHSNRLNASFENIREWAAAWNIFVSRACACTHISQAWSDLIRTALVCSPIVLVNDNNITTMVEQQHQHQATVFCMNTRMIMDILCSILRKLSSPSHLDALGQHGIFLGASEDDDAYDVPAAGRNPMEAECAMPLSIAALSLTDILIESSYQYNDAALPNRIVHGDVKAGFGISEEDAARVCALIVGAISSCAERGSIGVTSPNDGRAAVLSCALTRMLAFSKEASYCIISQNSTPSNILDIYANAIAHLFCLSTVPVFDNQKRYSDAHEAKGGAIALSARSGLSSLFGHLKSIEHEDSVSKVFCSNIFTLDALSTAVARLVHLITCDDDDVTHLLQQIALFEGGVQLLAKSGVTTKLLSFATAYAHEERQFLLSNMGTGVAHQLKPPSLLNSHLSLLNALLSSPLVSSDRVALAADAYQLLKVYCGTFERLLLSYPSNNDLTTKFIEALYLTYTSLSNELGGSNELGNALLPVDETLLTLENNVLRIACRLSAFPFPSRILPPLPLELINVEKIHTSQMRNITINLGNESTWWDNIPDSAKNSMPLPTPPTGSFDLQRFSSDQNGTGFIPWTERKYQYAISSAKCLETSTLFLIKRVHFVTQRDVSTFCIDAVAIAKGVCRCSDASRAIEDRLNVLSRPETDITKMLDFSHVDKSRWDYPLSHALKLEREYLLQLGSCLGQCAEKLVCLAIQDARRMAAIRSQSPSGIPKSEWAYFVGAMAPALDHTEMENKGVGCAFDDERSEGSIHMARALRQELEKMKAL